MYLCINTEQSVTLKFWQSSYTKGVIKICQNYKIDTTWQIMKIRTKTLQSTIPLLHHSSSPVHCLYTPYNASSYCIQQEMVEISFIRLCYSEFWGLLNHLVTYTCSLSTALCHKPTISHANQLIDFELLGRYSVTFYTVLFHRAFCSSLATLLSASI